jgi:hypothetical protein
MMTAVLAELAAATDAEPGFTAHCHISSQSLR